MWGLILLLGILLPVMILAVVGATIAVLVGFIRRRGGGEPPAFGTIVNAYAAIMTVIGLFIGATGAAFAITVGMGEVSHDFAYDDGFSGSSDESFVPPDDRDQDYDDTAEGYAIASAILLLVGGFMFLPHAGGIMLMRRRGIAGADPVVRGQNLVTLAIATIGFLAAGGTALAIFMDRFVDESADGWRDHHPGEPLAFAVVLLPVVGWAALRLWQELMEPAAAPPPSTALAASLPD